MNLILMRYSFTPQISSLHTDSNHFSVQFVTLALKKTAIGILQDNAFARKFKIPVKLQQLQSRLFLKAMSAEV